MTVTCCECGRPAGESIPEGLGGRWLERLLQLGVMCAECSAAAEEHREREEAEQERRDRAKHVEARREACGIPELLRGLDLTDPEPENANALDAARRWAIGNLRGLMLAGDIGRGKSHMAAAAAWARLERAPLRWVSVPVLFAHLALDFGNPLHEAAATTLGARTALVLDDLDKARPTEYAAERIFTAVDQRVTAGAALLVTTNLRPNELAARYPAPYGDAIVDRLTSYCEAFYLAGASRRQLRGVR